MTAVIQPQHRSALLLVAAAILCVYGLMWGMPNVFDFAQDSLVPQGKLAQIDADFEKLTAYRYPPAHLLLLQIVFVPARMVACMPAISGNLKNEATVFVLTARLVSAAMTVGTVWILFLLGRRLWNAAAGYAAALLFILSPLTLYYAKNANLDVPYVFWLAWATLIYVRILQENRERDYVWLGLLAALAVTTKDQAYAFLLFMPIPPIWNLFRTRENDSTTGRRAARLAVGAAAFLLAFALIHNLLFDWGAFVRHVETIVGPGSEGWRLFTRGPIGQARLLVETILRLFDAWTPAGVALAAIGAGLTFKRREDRFFAVALATPVVSYYLFFPAIVGYVPTRFVLPMLLIGCLFGGRAVAWLWEKTSLRPLSGRVIAAALVAWVGLAGLSVDFTMANYSRYTAQRWLDANASADTQMRWIGDMRDMPRFNAPLNPKPCEPTARDLAVANPEMVIISLPQEHPAGGVRSVRLSSIVRRRLGVWGLTEDEKRRRTGRDFMQKLVEGEFGYAVSRRFASPIGPFVPEVCESLNRTIVILERKP